MPYRFDVEMLDGSAYTITNLLGKGNSNAKTAKSDAKGVGYLTYSLSLAPASVSGFNVCSSSSHGCRTGCLFTSGLARAFPRTIQPGRIAKTRFYKLHKKEFVDRLITELAAAERRTIKLGLKLAVRLNVLSDVMWEREVPELFTTFSDITFYDYSKHYSRMMRFVAGNFPANYDLTFSRSESNEEKCLEVLKAGGNVAIPFKVKYSSRGYDPLPESYKGYKVFDADRDDMRFLDPKGGMIAGLRAKGQAKKDTSGFVVDPTKVAA